MVQPHGPIGPSVVQPCGVKFIDAERYKSKVSPLIQYIW